MQEPISIPEGNSRRKWLAAAGVIALIAFWNRAARVRKAAAIDCGPPEETAPMKMLTQDGWLVEVDVSKMRVLKKKASDEELRNWIKKK